MQNDPSLREGAFRCGKLPSPRGANQWTLSINRSRGLSLVGVGLAFLLLAECGPPEARNTLWLTDGEHSSRSEELFLSQLNVIFLVSPGRECLSCLRVAEKWQESLQGWPVEQVQIAYVLVARLEDAQIWRPRLQGEDGSSKVWIDPGNDLRRHFGLEGGPIIVGISARGRVRFAVPMGSDFWSRISYEKDFIQALVRESLKS